MVVTSRQKSPKAVFTHSHLLSHALLMKHLPPAGTSSNNNKHYMKGLVVTLANSKTHHQQIPDFHLGKFDHSAIVVTNNGPTELNNERKYHKNGFLRTHSGWNMLQKHSQQVDKAPQGLG